MNTAAEPFDWNLLHQLRQTPQLLEGIARSGNRSELQLQKSLRREFSADLVRAAVALTQLRNKALAKFSRAAQMWFDRQALEQATAEEVAQHKAARFHAVTGGLIGDLCCGIGADSIALAQQADVLSVDALPVRCLMTKWNAEIYERPGNVHPLGANVEHMHRLPAFLHIDPDRRTTAGRRTTRVEHYQPALPFLHELLHRCRGGAIKLGPASNFTGSFDGVEFELISLHGECKECTVWFGELGDPDRWRATVLPQGETLAGHPLDAIADVGPLQRYLYDPDPAVVRAGLVDLLAERLNLHRLDAEEEYLTGETLVDSPFVAAFEVADNLPNNQREIRRCIRQANIGQLEIKCRRIPVQADAVRRRLELTGTQPGVLLFARLGGKSRAVVARRMS